MTENKESLILLELTNQSIKITSAVDSETLEVNNVSFSEGDVKNLAQHLLAELQIDGVLTKKDDRIYTIDGQFKNGQPMSGALKAAVKSFEPDVTEKQEKVPETAKKALEKPTEPSKSKQEHIMAIKRTDKGYAVEVKPTQLDPEVVTMMTQLEVNAGLSKALEIGLQIAKTSDYELMIKNDIIYLMSK